MLETACISFVFVVENWLIRTPEANSGDSGFMPSAIAAEISAGLDGRLLVADVSGFGLDEVGWVVGEVEVLTFPGLWSIVADAVG